VGTDRDRGRNFPRLGRRTPEPMTTSDRKIDDFYGRYRSKNSERRRRYLRPDDLCLCDYGCPTRYAHFP
jgi:hypothetical protein